ncbi:hypothetical protein C8R43DRAFT_1136456 [Mycena crocata]|nr:hypothetical protein C8R43DRAFT_1136456 [Mycena crocata]
MAPSGPSHKRKKTVPLMTVAGTVSVAHSRSHDNNRERARTSVVQQGATPAAAAEDTSRWWADDLRTNAARLDPNFSYGLGDESLSAQADPWVDDGIQVLPPPRNANSDRPLKTWYPYNDEYIEEQLRREGRGSPRVYSKCAKRHEHCTGIAEFRCVDQACVGEIMHCATCVVAAHAQLPTHFLERWTGTHFKKRRNWLHVLGLRVQLGHPPGVICPYRFSAAKDFVLYDLSGVHEINVDFCGCGDPDDEQRRPLKPRRQLMRACWWPATVKVPNTCATFAVLRFFQIVNCLGKLSAYDFLRGLEKCTSNDGLEKPPDRRKPFMHIMRQFRDVKRGKRHKRGHKRGGMKATRQGELTVGCRQCPRPKYNIPDDWDKIDPAYRFIYFLFLAQDANFRLSNRAVSSELSDPILGDGFGYFCRREGEEGYKAHIAKHVNDQEISNCSGFQAMFMANTRRVKGLRTTGIGGVTCSRHNMWCANGIGDLQLGERNCNMDFLLVSVLMTFTLLCVVVSYDIACQYAINFWDRMSKFPEPMRLTHLAPSNVWWKVPNFHLPAHKKPCHSPYSFHWMWGAGMTHGEGVEQNWAFSNGAAASTRLMGPGARVAALEDVFGFHNYDRQLAMHRILAKRIAVNIKEGLRHRAVFEAFNSGLTALRPNEVAEWRAWVIRWEATQHHDAKDSPFETVQEVVTLRDIQLKIAEEEYICTDDLVEIEQEHTPGSFIAMGLALEETQRRLTVDVKALKDPSVTQRLAFTKRRTTMLKHIHKFRAIQRIYMPALRALLSDTEKQMYDGNGEQLPECTRLFMPSEILDKVTRKRACAAGLPDVEARMREGEASEALEAVRNGLRTRTMTNRYKVRNFTGQGMMTRGQGILRDINIKIHRGKIRYRYARAALLGLWGHGGWEESLKILADDDVRALNERALTLEEKAQQEHWAEIGGAIIEGGVARAAGVARGEGNHELSWIWYTPGLRAPGDDEDNDPRLIDALRVEWCKAFARSRRYAEDVRILREEMGRTIESGKTEAADWDALAEEESMPGATAELTEGRRAYAAQHAETERETCQRLRVNWALLMGRADAFLSGEPVSETDAQVTVELELGDELDPEEEEARLEAEEEE